ncbi:MAG: PA14 domain-containing protein, partial [Bacteroidota bacterium]
GNDIILGHSFGGVFSMYALLTEPELFDSYIAADPSFWWDDQYMVQLASEKLPTLSAEGKALFVTGRADGDAYAGMGIDKMDSVLKKLKPEGMFWKSVAYPNESHGSSRLKSVYDGLRYAFDGYGNHQVTFHPMAGIVEAGKELEIWNMTRQGNVRYTTDGSMPTKDSPRMQEKIKLSEPGVLKARILSPRRNYDSDVKEGQFIAGTSLNPVKKPKKLTQGGLKFKFYQGEWNTLPDFKSLKPDSTGIAGSGFSMSSLPAKTNFACLMEGFFEAKSDGYYAFAVSSDDGSKLYIGDQLIIDHDGKHPMGNERSYVLPLSKGFHPIRIEYFQAGGGLGLELIYVTPDSEGANGFPLEAQYYID